MDKLEDLRNDVMNRREKMDRALFLNEFSQKLDELCSDCGCGCEKCRILRGDTKDGYERLKNRADLKDVVGSFSFDPFLAMLRLCKDEKKPEPEMGDDKYVEEKNPPKKLKERYGVNSYGKEATFKDGGFDSLEEAQNHSIVMIKNGFKKVEIVKFEDDGNGST